jgi:serine protease Do
MKKAFTLSIIIISFLFSPLSIKASNNTYLAETSKAFSNVGKKAIPAVVFIKATFNGTNNTMSSQEDPFESFNDEFFKKFFNFPQGKGLKQEQFAAGSGCIISKDGYILTNNHIVKDADTITVTLNNGKDYDAKLIGTDSKTDLAVIKIIADNLPYLEFGNSETLEIGEWVVAIGSPFQLHASLTVGVVSAKGRQNLNITAHEDFIQTDAAINPGNSGGPLLNLDGKIVGINTAILSQTGGYLGIGFAIPSNMAKHIEEQIIDNGSVKRGHLGISIQSIDKEMAEALELENTEAVLIAEIIKNSAAEKAGLKQGDIIIGYNNLPMKNITTFNREISLMNPGAKVILTIIRNHKKSNITVTLEQSPDSQLSSNKILELGLEVSDIKDVPSDVIKKWQFSDNIEGVMITSVKSNSLSMKAGLRPGMVIMQINHQKIKNINDFNTSIADMDKKKYLLMLIKYQNITKFVSIKIK